MWSSVELGLRSWERGRAEDERATRASCASASFFFFFFSLGAVGMLAAMPSPNGAPIDAIGPGIWKLKQPELCRVSTEVLVPDL